MATIFEPGDQSAASELCIVESNARSWFRRPDANSPHLAFEKRLRSHLRSASGKLTVSRPLQTPPRPGFYALRLNNQTGHVVALKALATTLSCVLSPLHTSACQERTCWCCTELTTRRCLLSKAVTSDGVSTRYDPCPSGVLTISQGCVS